MSYTRNYSETVYKTVSKTVYYDYPASENGGSSSVYVEIEAEIPVDVNIHVDTNPFDRSVEYCGDNVNLLTAAVVATEAAEIASIERNSKKVGSAIVGGFFSYIRSEISQQISELTLNIEAQLMHLKELAQSCLAKKKQMEVDYHRISSRYVKIFDDLNNEVSNRVFELDRPVFLFKKETDHHKVRTSDNDLVNTVAIFGLESSDLQSRVTASMAKKRALDTIMVTKLFLLQQKSLNSKIQQRMLNESLSGFYYTPVCFIETNTSPGVINRSVYNAPYLSILGSKKKQDELIEKFTASGVPLKKLTLEDMKHLSLYFNEELNRKLNENSQHSARVRDTIQKMLDFALIN